MSKKEQKVEKTTESRNDGNTMLPAVPTRVHSFDVEELAAYLCGLDYDEVEYDDIENALYEKFNVDFDSFHNIVSYLLTMVDVGSSPLTGERYKGFSRHINKKGDGIWLIKVPVAPKA